jgi:hypothetical protein
MIEWVLGIGGMMVKGKNGSTHKKICLTAILSGIQVIRCYFQLFTFTGDRKSVAHGFPLPATLRALEF